MGIKRYVARRLAQLVVTYWAFITILFVLFRMMPGDPTSRYVMSGLSGDARERVIEQLGLNDPLHVQYVKYMEQLLQFDFGTSFIYREPVAEIIVVKFWNTVFLMMGTLLIAFAIGFVGGALLAWWRGSTTEVVGVVVTLITRSIPVFFSGIIVLMVFSFWLDLFPAGGMRTIGAETTTFWGRYFSWDFVRHATLPLIAGVVYYMSVPLLLMRNTMLEVLNADFITTKRAEGIPEMQILFKHAARNSILPMVTLGAIVVGTAIGGQVLLEVVFNWPGMGRAMVDAVNSNDYPLAMASFFLMGSVVIFLNLVADLTYAYLDPRVVYD